MSCKVFITERRPHWVSESDSKLLIRLQQKELSTLLLLPSTRCNKNWGGIKCHTVFFRNVSWLTYYGTRWVCVSVLVKCHKVVSAVLWSPAAPPRCTNHQLVKMRRKFLQTHCRRWSWFGNEQHGKLNHICWCTAKHTDSFSTSMWEDNNETEPLLWPAPKLW